MKSISDVVSGAGLAGYAEVALILFFLVFVAIGLRVLFARKSTFAREAHLPFDDAEGNRSLTPIPTRPSESATSTRHAREEP